MVMRRPVQLIRVCFVNEIKKKIKVYFVNKISNKKIS
jgi:hypothetical protein